MAKFRDTDNFKFTDHLHTKIPLQLEINDFEKKLHEKLHAMLAQYNRVSFVLEACKFVKSFVSLALMSPFIPKAYTADTIYSQNKSQIEK